MACLRLVTFLPLRPLFSVPRFISCISSRTFSPALGLYFLPEDDFFEELFFVAIPTFSLLGYGKQRRIKGLRGDADIPGRRGVQGAGAPGLRH